MLRTAFLFVFMLLCAASLYAQSISGRVLDQETKESLPGAYVFIKTINGETLQSTFTDGNGKFSFQKPNVSIFNLEISFVGYSTNVIEIDKIENNSVGDIEIAEDGQLLETFEIRAQVLTGEVKGDTVAFNANAFKTRPQANADELVRKMPGVVMRGGTIEVQGEVVGRVLVDGEPFFGDNPAMAMANIPVEIIDKIEFLDQRSDQAVLTGFDDGNTTKTINIITKKEVKSGMFGRLTAGYGSNNNYLGSGALNFFKGSRRTTVLGLTNNINQQNFSSDDLAGAFGEDGGQAGGGGRGGNPLQTWERPGITVTNAAGFNFSDKFDQGKAKITGSYFFNDNRNTLSRVSSRTYVLPSDSLQLYNQETNDISHSQRHRLDLRLDYDISDKHAIIWRPRFNTQIREFTNSTVAQNLVAQNNPINEIENITVGTNQWFSFDNDFTYRFKFNKPGRVLSTSATTRLNSNERIANLTSVNTDFETAAIDSLIQNTTFNSNNFNYRVSFDFNEPISEKSQLRLQYRIGNDLGDTKQEVRQRLAEATVFQLDSALSNTFENSYLQQQSGVGYRFNNEKFRIFTSVDYEVSNLDSDRIFPGFENTKRTFRNVIPRAVVNYNASAKTNIRLDYRTRTDAPSIRQLQEVIDNRNPIQIFSGNADLVQEYEHRVFARIRNIDTETSRSFFMFVSGSKRNNYLGNSTLVASADTLIGGEVLLRQGGQFNKPVNLDGYWDARSYVSYGFPISAIKSNLNLSTRANYVNRPGIINGELNVNRNLAVSPGLGISSNVSERLDFNLSTEGSFNTVKSTIQTSLDNNFYTQNTRFDFYWQPLGGFFVSSNVNHLIFEGLGEGFDRTVILMNADMGYRFGAKEKLEAKVTVFDLLNQNTSINRQVTDVFIEDQRTNVLTRFVMLSLTYNLRSFGKRDS
ncbi:outer membrane beta-barrel protein [Belliella kenyensis]|uniref:Outer membrane beta-barrel protein n=1 Tax=Belliella kenyensis TaxID=1472724 RepID=A0ABV8EN95_9BACT|nr:TonB-dependent receptor [Belliella kenyensis]MCH7403182.1 outer membrane beta-barrel protein [Belliella kenyensis]MDN3604793.1 TonB-dependent receptor [Belliella kenyensis]